MSTEPAKSPDEWATGNEARQITGLTWYMLHKHVMLGKVGILAPPGEHIRYRRADLETIADARRAQPEREAQPERTAALAGALQLEGAGG